MTHRHNALDRAAAALSTLMEQYHMTLDGDRRILTTPIGRYIFAEYMKRQQCEAVIRRYARTMQNTDQFAHDIHAERMQGKLV